MLALLLAGYPQEAIEPTTESVWLSLLEDLDAEATTQVVLRMIKTEPRFPSMAELRQAVRMRRERERQESDRLALTGSTEPIELPAHVKEWRMAKGWA